MSDLRRRGPGRFAVSGLVAMAVASALGVVAQRWMSYDLLSVGKGLATWCLAAALLTGMGVTTALLIGVPSYVLTGRLGLTRSSRAVAYCVLGSVLTTIAHRSIAPFARTSFDHVVIPALGLAFFGVFYVLYYRGTEQPKKPIHGAAHGRR